MAQPRRIRWLAGATAALLVPALLVPAAAQGSTTTEPVAPAPADTDLVPDGPDPVEIVPVFVPTPERLEALRETGVDLLEEVGENALGLSVQALVTEAEAAQLEELGFAVGEPSVTSEDAEAFAASVSTLAAEVQEAEAEALAVGDDLRVQRAVHLGDAQGDFVEIEVWSEAGAGSAAVSLRVELDAGAGTQIGDGGAFTLARFVDAGQYMFHRTNSPRPVAAVPTRMRVTSMLDGEVLGSAEATFSRVFDDDLPTEGPGTPHAEWGDLATGFVDHYVDPTEATERIESLAAEFPGLAEIVELPNETNGYQRKAMHLTGGVQTNQAVGVTTHAWGHEGGNDVTIAYVDPGAANAPLSVGVTGTDVTVSLGTGASGQLVSTGAQVVAAINGSPAAAELLYAYTYRGNAGAGVAQPRARESLSDFLRAPEHVERGPFTPKVIRIGKHRDGSRVGVYLYSQEHAREWVTPITALETAERLLRNYESNATIRRLVDNLDIFIVPVVNPDGAHYSMHDNWSQRRNMTNHCPVTGAHDANARNSWGVDLNRNFRAYSLFDGYAGASTSCTSDTFAGPSELSEPESRNEVWLVDNHPNITFSMNTHTHGGYFMWAPGSYANPGRVSERPSMGVESYFYEASDHILSRIEDHRGTVLWPSRVGPISDVLYSAAGNSADDFYYNYGIFGWSFEAGAPRWNGTSWVSVGFTPPVDEGIEEAMEFSNGWLGILEVAYRYSKDTVKPSATLTPGEGTYTGPVEVTFELSEPADVYYTLDGSRPTYSSPRLEFIGPRQGVETLTVDATTTVRWFARDMAGNVSNGYDPSSKAQNFSKATITIAD